MASFSVLSKGWSLAYSSDRSISVHNVAEWVIACCNGMASEIVVIMLNHVFCNYVPQSHKDAKQCWKHISKRKKVFGLSYDYVKTLHFALRLLGCEFSFWNIKQTDKLMSFASEQTFKFKNRVRFILILTYPCSYRLSCNKHPEPNTLHSN